MTRDTRPLCPETQHCPRSLTTRVGSAAPASDAIAAAVSRAGVPLTIVDLASDDIGHNWDNIPLVLVRPDQHIA